METIIDKFGRVVIPKEIRDHLGLKPGETLQIEESEKELILRPVREGSSLQVKEGLMVYSGVAAGDIIEATRSHRKERIKKTSLLKKK